MDQAVTIRAGRIVRNAAQAPDQDPNDGPRVRVPRKEPTMPDTVTITHPDGRTAQVSPKVAAFLVRNEGWTEGKPKAAPKPKATEPAPEG